MVYVYWEDSRKKEKGKSCKSTHLPTFKPTDIKVGKLDIPLRACFSEI
jgi:hypothetical protein